MSNIWRSIDLPLIKSGVELDLRWTKNCIISETSSTAAVSWDNTVEVTKTTGTAFQIYNAERCVPAVTLSMNDKIKFFAQSKKGFRRTVSWNKYRSEITTQPKNNNFDYVIDLTFRIINRLFALSLKKGDDDDDDDDDDDSTRNYFDVLHATGRNQIF